MYNKLKSLSMSDQGVSSSSPKSDSSSNHDILTNTESRCPTPSQNVPVPDTVLDNCILAGPNPGAEPFESMSRGAASSHHASTSASNYPEERTMDYNLVMPHFVPIVILNTGRELHILLKVSGMISGHCVKIVETVLKGRGFSLDIPGLLDVCAMVRCDSDYGIALIRVHSSSDPCNVEKECLRRLSMIGYRVKAFQIPFPRGKLRIDANATVLANFTSILSSVPAQSSDQSESASNIEKQSRSSAVPLNVQSENTHISINFDWLLSCSCSDSIPSKEASFCPIHSQLNDATFNLFLQVQEKSRRIDYRNFTICHRCGLKLGSCFCFP